MTTIRQRAQRDEDGFTLLELMVVVLVIAALIAIAVPNFLGAKRQAADRAVQSNVRNAFVAARIWFIASQAYTEVPADMESLEPSLTWTNAPLTPSSPPRSVYVDAPNGETVIVGGRTSNGRCFYIKDVLGSSARGVYYDVHVAGSADCPTVDPAVIDDPRW